MSGGIHVQHDDFVGKLVGIMAAILAVLLSIFTISAHRAHTETIVFQNESNDLWSQYQAKRIRDYQLQMNLDLLQVLASGHTQVPKLINTYQSKRAEYSKELETIKQNAELKLHESRISQKKALHFDLAEGVLEIALVMSSLYFIARKIIFPFLGLFFSVVGVIIGVFSFLL